MGFLMEKSDDQTSTSSRITGLLLTNHLIKTAVESQPKLVTLHIRLVHSLCQIGDVAVGDRILLSSRSTSFTFL